MGEKYQLVSELVLYRLLDSVDICSKILGASLNRIISVCRSEQCVLTKHSGWVCCLHVSLRQL